MSSVKTIYFLRHAQGEHNIAGEADPIGGYLRDDLLDAVLSEYGVEQCTNFAKMSNFHEELDLIVVSPMRRTLQTAALCFPDAIDRIPFVAVEEVREQTGMHPCDCRLSIDELKACFPHVCFDEISYIEDPLYHLYLTGREPDAHVLDRGRKFFEWLHRRKESNIMIVTHSAFLRCIFKSLLKLSIDSQVSDYNRFANCEVKCVRLEFPTLQGSILAHTELNSCI